MVSPGLAADRDHSGQVSFLELRDFVTARVAALTQGLQNPTVRRGKLGDFVVY